MRATCCVHTSSATDSALHTHLIWHLFYHVLADWKSKRSTENLRATIVARHRASEPSSKKFVTEVPIEEDDGDGDVWLHDKFSATDIDPAAFPPQKSSADDAEDESPAQSDGDDEHEDEDGQDGVVVLVNNIGDDISQDDIQQLFELFGEVKAASVYVLFREPRVRTCAHARAVTHRLIWRAR